MKARPRQQRPGTITIRISKLEKVRPERRHKPPKLQRSKSNSKSFEMPISQIRIETMVEIKKGYNELGIKCL
jgi:hypothetical protein